jgi:hypothetical protein
VEANRQLFDSSSDSSSDDDTLPIFRDKKKKKGAKTRKRKIEELKKRVAQEKSREKPAVVDSIEVGEDTDDEDPFPASSSRTPRVMVSPAAVPKQKKKNPPSKMVSEEGGQFKF